MPGIHGGQALGSLRLAEQVQLVGKSPAAIQAGVGLQDPGHRGGEQPEAGDGLQGGDPPDRNSGSPAAAGAVSWHLAAWMVSSCQTITLPSSVRWVSSCRVVTSSASEFVNAARDSSVHSPRPPRWLCRSNEPLRSFILSSEVAAPAVFDDGVPASSLGAATAGLAMVAIRAAAAAAVRTAAATAEGKKCPSLAPGFQCCWGVNPPALHH